MRMAHDTIPAQPVGFLAALLWTTLLLLLTNAGILFITHKVMPQPSGWGLFGGWLLNLIIIFVLAGWIGGKLGGRGGGVFFLVILFAIYALVYGLTGGHLPRAFRLHETPVIPVRDADLDAYRDADVFHFSDGTVDVKRSATRILPGRRHHTLYYHVAPLLPPDWKPGDLIPAWVAQSGWNELPPASWKEAHRGGYAVGLDSTYRELTLETIQRHALKSSQTCPILHWSADPAKGFRSSAYWELGFLLAIDLLGFIFLIFSVGRSTKPG